MLKGQGTPAELGKSVSTCPPSQGGNSCTKVSVYRHMAGELEDFQESLDNFARFAQTLFKTGSKPYIFIMGCYMFSCEMFLKLQGGAYKLHVSLAPFMQRLSAFFFSQCKRKSSGKCCGPRGGERVATACQQAGVSGLFNV